ncbi:MULTISPECIES: histidine phosphatase family protein [unclassified Isoptericola]|uniref:histidine phosphatase family protein n=1 Tax=unclassified Isoptericola TaxID=2623355 RepID=UPI002712DF17|nr:MULTISPECIES: histidine phosphatase family protein [unclassified Isoptericola]MDO8143550.1 histidine phosphatase family protein [Isoptericola sp. 178]MDO8147416.1 histidine phosphatase family protein [Isoptericola sp. b515]MDO8150275.1 histidine phosphatase family protein [Isoptericola sp. b408]
MNAPAASPSRLVLLRHGDTEWALAGRHTGRTDVPLTRDGERQARAAGQRLAGLEPVAVHCSPLQRAHRTAELAGFGDAVTDPDLAEWDYGPVEGLTSAEVGGALGRPYEIFRDGVDLPALREPGGGGPSGESLADVRVRTDRFLRRVRPALANGGTVLVVAHGHLLRVLATSWLGVEAGFGVHLELGCAAVSELGSSHGRPTIASWNLVG